MAKISKIVYGGDVLIDLTGDTVTADQLLTGATAHGKDGEEIVGTCDFDVNSQDADVAVGEVLKGKTFYARGQKYTGTMPNNGAIAKKITTKTESVAIAQGYHDGTGTVSIDSKEQSKIIPANIREGITVLGVTGTMSGSENEKLQAKTVTPSTEQQEILPDADYTCLSSVTVEAIPYAESNNSAGGLTVTIA